MKKITQIAFGLVLVMGLAASLMPANASCGGARAVTSATSALTFFYTPGNPFTPTGAYPVTPYGGSTTYYLNGVFWSFGGGDPAYGLGNDSGAFKGISYILAYFGGVPTWMGGGYYGGFGAFMGGPSGHWQIPGVDGCIDADGSNPDAFDPDECNVVLLTDEANQVGYFAALSVGPTAGGDFEYTSNTGFPAQITLAQIPKPTIVGTTTVGNVINVTATVDPGTVTPANGFYFACHEQEILDGYRIYVRSSPGHDAEKPVQIQTRALDQIFGPPLNPWIPVTDKMPIGSDAQFALDCSAAGDTDFYLCATLTFGGVAPGAANYELKSCSTNATKVECGPQLADPEERPRLDQRIDRGDDRPTTRRGARSGR